MRSSRLYMMSLPFLSWPLTPLRKKIMAPRGPRSDLCVVVVTTSEYSKGEGTTPAQQCRPRNELDGLQRGPLRKYGAGESPT